MPEHIDLPGGGRLIGETLEESRNSRFHKKIVEVTHIEGTKRGYRIVLACGHFAIAFGDLEKAAGVVLCMRCADEAHENG